MSIEDDGGNWFPQELLRDAALLPAFLLRRSQQIFSAVHRSACQAAGVEMTEPQLDALCILAASDRPLHQMALARGLGYDRSTTGSIVSRLVQRGFVEQTEATDRRRRNLILAAGAKQVVLNVEKASESALRDTLSQAEIKSAVTALQEVAAKSDSGAPEWHPLRNGEQQISIDWAILGSPYTTPRFLVRRCMQIGAALTAKETASLEVNHGSQFAILQALSERSPLDQATIGRILWIDRSRVSLTLAFLEERGLIHRIADAADGRRMMVTMTVAGAKALADGKACGWRASERMFEDLSPAGKDRLVRALSRVVAAQPGFIGTQIRNLFRDPEAPAQA